MAIWHVPTQKDDDVITADGITLEVNLAVGVQPDGEARGRMLRNMQRALDAVGLWRRVRFRLTHFRHCDAPNQPRVCLKGGMNLLILHRPIAGCAICTLR